VQHRSRPYVRRAPLWIGALSVSIFACLGLTSTVSAQTTTDPTTTPSGTPTSSPQTVPQTVPDGKGRTGPQITSGEPGTTLPATPFGVRVVLAAQVENPIALVQRAGDEAKYILEKPGRVRAIRKGVLDLTPLLDIVSRVSSTNEQGLLGIAFHPTDQKRVFLDYTDLKGSVTVSEFSFDGKTIDSSSERVILKIAKPFAEHNAGTIVFDKSGALLIGIGDGGGAGDPQNNGQRTDTLLGKVLRIIPDPSGSRPYSIPTDNPFAKDTRPLGSNRPPARPEIFAFGLRNPWRISIDRGTGDVWVPDVGQATQEEIDRIPAGTSGQNFGWRNREGTKTFKGGGRPAGASEPVYDYSHTEGRCAVVGGFVYRGTAIPALVGWYVFSDVCSGQLMALKPGKKYTAYSLGVKVTYMTAFGEGNDGELWITSYEGSVGRLLPK
jgi:glucose/arabinose dehydrogenase